MAFFVAAGFAVMTGSGTLPIMTHDLTHLLLLFVWCAISRHGRGSSSTVGSRRGNVVTSSSWQRLTILLSLHGRLVVRLTIGGHVRKLLSASFSRNEGSLSLTLPIDCTIRNMAFFVAAGFAVMTGSGTLPIMTHDLTHLLLLFVWCAISRHGRGSIAANISRGGIRDTWCGVSVTGAVAILLLQRRLRITMATVTMVSVITKAHWLRVPVAGAVTSVFAMVMTEGGTVPVGLGLASAISGEMQIFRTIPDLAEWPVVRQIMEVATPASAAKGFAPAPAAKGMMIPGGRLVSMGGRIPKMLRLGMGRKIPSLGGGGLAIAAVVPAVSSTGGGALAVGRRLLPEAWRLCPVVSTCVQVSRIVSEGAIARTRGISEASSATHVAGIGFTKISRVLSSEAVARRVPDHVSRRNLLEISSTFPAI